MPGKRRTPEQRARASQWMKDHYWTNVEENRRKARERHELRKNDPEYMEARKQYRLTWKLRDRYGLTVEEWESMNMAQGGKCYLCGQVPSGKPPTNGLYVDHDHSTGKVRALLCHPCNSGIGQLQDDPELLAKAAQYVYMHKPLVAVA